ncbi:MAG: glycosyltransferase [Chthoniobacteraceae bacterium]
MTPENTTTAMAPMISVLIPAYNEELLIGKVIQAVYASFAALDYKAWEIIVCDNNSTDRTSAVAIENGAQVVKEPHNQIARARNTAAKSARGKWLIFIDADTYMTSGILGKTIAAFEGGKICSGGCHLKFDKQNIGWFPTIMTGLWNSISGFVNLAAGSYLFCYREAWADIGGFDEEVYAGEEIFFSQKLKAWGKERGLKFKILTGEPVITSARKMDWYGQRQLFYHVLKMMWPGSIKKRESCELWYTRPE